MLTGQDWLLCTKPATKTYSKNALQPGREPDHVAPVVWRTLAMRCGKSLTKGVLRSILAPIRPIGASVAHVRVTREKTVTRKGKNLG